MSKNIRWRVLIILAVVALSAWSIYPIKDRIKLGLDLKGGVHLVLRVHTDDALRLETETALERMRSELAKAGATGVTGTVVDVTTFEVTGVPEAQSAMVRQLATDIEGTF